jgi:hypothetical protein
VSKLKLGLFIGARLSIPRVSEMNDAIAWRKGAA